MDFVTHFPQTLRRHDGVGGSGSTHEVGTFPSHANDLHTGGILPIVHPRDHSATQSASIHSVGQRPEIYRALLEEFPKGYRDTVYHECSLPPIDRWSVREDHTDFRGHAASMRPGS